MEELIKAVKKLKKLLKEQKKELKVVEEYYLSMLLKNKSAFEPHIEVKDIKVDEQGEVEVPVVGTVDSETGEVKMEKVQSPKDVEVTLEGEPDLDLIKEQQDSTGLN